MKTNPRLRFWSRHGGTASWTALLLVAGLEMGLVADGLRCWQGSLQGSVVTPASNPVMMPVDPGIAISNPGYYL